MVRNYELTRSISEREEMVSQTYMMAVAKAMFEHFEFLVNFRRLTCVGRAFGSDPDL
jgi:hypothetical protein